MTPRIYRIVKKKVIDIKGTELDENASKGYRLVSTVVDQKSGIIVWTMEL